MKRESLSKLYSTVGWQAGKLETWHLVLHCGMDKHYSYKWPGDFLLITPLPNQTSILFSSWDGFQTVHSWLLRWMCLLGTPQTSDTHVRQACVPSRTPLCSPFWLSSLDQDRHSPQHPSYTNCFSLPLHCQVPISSLSPDRRDTHGSEPNHRFFQMRPWALHLAVLKNGKSRRAYPLPMI